MPSLNDISCEPYPINRLAFLSYGIPRVISSTPPGTKLNEYFLYLRPILRFSGLVQLLTVPIIILLKFINAYSVRCFVGSLYLLINSGLIKSLLDPLSINILTRIPLIFA